MRPAPSSNSHSQPLSRRRVCYAERLGGVAWQVCYGRSGGGNGVQPTQLRRTPPPLPWSLPGEHALKPRRTASSEYFRTAKIDRESNASGERTQARPAPAGTGARLTAYSRSTSCCRAESRVRFASSQHCYYCDQNNLACLIWEIQLTFGFLSHCLRIPALFFQVRLRCCGMRVVTERKRKEAEAEACATLAAPAPNVPPSRCGGCPTSAPKKMLTDRLARNVTFHS